MWPFTKKKYKLPNVPHWITNMIKKGNFMAAVGSYQKWAGCSEQQAIDKLFTNKES